MRKHYPCLLALGLMVGGAMYGAAQTYSGRLVANAFFDKGDVDRDNTPNSARNQAWEEGRKRAEEFGYRDGLNDGRRDFESHRNFQPTRGDGYKHGNNGYDGRFGDRNRYRDAYREAYARGYHEGYYSRAHEHDHR